MVVRNTPSTGKMMMSSSQPRSGTPSALSSVERRESKRYLQIWFSLFGNLDYLEI